MDEVHVVTTAEARARRTGANRADVTPTVEDVADFESPYLKGKTLEELIQDLGTVAQPGSSTHEMIRAAIQAEMVERLAAPRRWAWVAAAAAVVSALAAVASVIAGAS